MPPAPRGYLFVNEAPTATHPDLQFLDEWLLPRVGSGLDQLAFQLMGFVEGTEKRVRKRRPLDQLNFERLMRCVVANLVRAVIEQPKEGGWLAVEYVNGRTKPSCYRSAAFGAPWTDLSALLEKTDLVERREGSIPTDGHRGQAPSIRPTPKFRELVEVIPTEDISFGRAPEEFLLVVTQSEWKEGARSGAPVKTKKWLEYLPTPEVASLVERVGAINGHIVSAEIRIDAPQKMAKKTAGDHDMLLRRYFFVPPALEASDQSRWFRSGGRLFGGFWQTMRKTERQYIRIDGERLAEVDFRSMNAHIAYMLAQAQPPEGDLYAIPGLEGYRPDVKMLFNAMLSKGPGQTTSRWPQSIRDEAAQLTDEQLKTADKPAGSIVRSGLKPKDAVAMITSHHKDIAPLFMAGRIGEIQHLESETLISALETLKTAGVVALPIHDAILLPVSFVSAGEQAMADAALRVLGVEVRTSTTCPL